MNNVNLSALAQPDNTQQSQYSLSSNLQSLEREHGFESCQVEGDIPADLSGTLYRNGPGVFERFGVSYGHWFGGLGVINAMRFSAGRAQCAAKIVQTPERKKEQRKQRAIFADYGRTASGAWYKKWLRPPHNAANTSVLFWQNKLFALEEGHLATEIDPDTLNTKQTTRFSIKKMERFSAHPSWVSDLQCGFNFGMTLGRKSKLQLFKLPKKGQAELLAEHELPGICNIHDFVATNTHLVFFIAPVRLNTKDALFGKKSFAHAQEWRPELDTEIWCIPLNAPSTKTVIKTDPFFVFHFGNAFDVDVGSKIIVDYIRYKDFQVHNNLFDVQQHIDKASLAGTLTRAEIDLDTEKVHHYALTSTLSEFPIVPSKFQGKVSPFLFTATIGLAGQAASINRIDFDGDGNKINEDRFTFEEGVFCSEPIFVAKQQHPTEGYVLSLAYDARQHKSFLVILNAQNFQQGILAKVYFNQNIPLGFHGRWVNR